MSALAELVSLGPQGPWVLVLEYADGGPSGWAYRARIFLAVRVRLQSVSRLWRWAWRAIRTLTEADDWSQPEP